MIWSKEYVGESDTGKPLYDHVSHEYRISFEYRRRGGWQYVVTGPGITAPGRSGFTSIRDAKSWVEGCAR